MQIIVPINVDVLRVSPSPEQTNPQMVKMALYDFSQSGANPLAGSGSLIASNNFEHAQEPIHNKPGLHVHWSIPKVYTRGVQDNTSGDVGFPNLPNRWIVLRFFNNTGAEMPSACIKNPSGFSPSVQMWILESDAHVAPDTEGFENSSNIPWMSDPQNLSDVSYRVAGQKITLDGSWVEPNGTSANGVEYLGKLLQAPMAYGETFTAFYQNCGNIFGIYDDLSDLFTSPNCLESDCQFSASYAVIGWVSPMSNDTCVEILTNAVNAYNAMPAGTQPVFQDYIQEVFEKQMKWSLDDYSGFTPGNAAQTQGVLSGISANINWNISAPGNPTYPTALPDASGVKVSIGNTGVEALSAYLNNLESGPTQNDPGTVSSNTEWLLNALQYGQLPNLGSGELGAGQLDEYLHSKTFGSRQGGFLWTVRNIMTPNSKAAPQPDVEVTLPLPLAKMLSLLNSSQYGYDTLSNELDTRRQKLFFDWCYHINAIENNVITAPDFPFDNDLSGDYLVEGLLQLFPRMMQAGANGAIAGPNAASTPYQYQPAPFAIQAPASLESNLAGYEFNATANTTAAATIGQLMALFYNLEGLVPRSIGSLTQTFQTILLLLEAAQKSGNDAGGYITQALALLNTAQSNANSLASEFGAALDPVAGIQAVQTSIQADGNALGKLNDPNTGMFTPIQINSSQTLPLTAGEVYTGNMLSFATYQNTGSWGASGAFPGMKSLIDQCTGQNSNSFHIADIQLAGLYLATAYFWRTSGQIASHTTPYYIQLAQLEISNALADANAASTSLGNALGLLNTAGGTLTNIQQGISNLRGTVIPALITQLSAATPDVPGAISAVQNMLVVQSAGSSSLNLNGLSAACNSSDWLNFISDIEAAWMTLLNRLPYAQQVSILSTWLNGQVDTQYVLESTPGNNFWQPAEPVILLAEAGNGGNIISPVNRNGRADMLPCRLDADIITAAVNFPPAISNLAATVNPNISGLSQVLQQLAQEAFLLCPEMETVVSPANLQQAATNNQALQFDNFHRVVLNQAPPGLSGKLPYYIAWNWSDGTDPFLPLFIFWEAEYAYSQQLNFSTGQIPPAYLQSQFGLDQYLVDNQLLPAAANQFLKNGNQPNYFNAYGVITLSGAATSNLCDQIKSYCQQSLNYDPTQGPPQQSDPNYAEELRLYQAYTDYKTLNVLSQGMSGFNSAMLQRAQELQLPLNIPASWTSPSDKNLPMSDFWPTEMLFNQSQGWSALWASESINMDAFAKGDQAVYFNPLRAGFMQLQEITLVDIFGRFVSIVNVANNINPPLVVGEALSSQTPNPLPDHPVYLPPRIVQPSRLLFNWLSADSPDVMQDFTEWNPHPAASPVCGWLLPNHLDGSLMCYGSDGSPLGSLRNIDTGIHWFTVPGEAYTPGTPNRQLMLSDLQNKGANPQMQAFLETFVYANDGSVSTANLADFMGVMDLAQQFIITPGMQEDQSLAVLIGQPLVLVQATLRLETMGLPNTSLDARTYMPWNGPGPQFQLDGNGFIPYNFDNFNTGGLGALQIPLRLGAVEYEKNQQVLPYYDDGLVGFFVGNDFSTFYTPVQLAQNAGRIISTWAGNTNPIVLQPNGASITVTMVIDPRAAVHATTGILPVQDIQIPSDQYTQALNALLVTFLTAPVLRTAAPINIPAPAETGYNWSWQQIGAPDEALQPSQLNSDAVFPASPQYLVDGWLKLKENGA